MASCPSNSLVPVPDNTAPLSTIRDEYYLTPPSFPGWLTKLLPALEWLHSQKTPLRRCGRSRLILSQIA